MTTSPHPSAGAASFAFGEVPDRRRRRVLTSLAAPLAAHLYEALAADAPGFGADVQALLTFVSDRPLDAGRLQRTLDAERSALAGLPRKILTAWYTGIVGVGAGARCVTFETSLMHQVVADRLSAPSYCYGPHASWTQAPR